MQVNQQNTQLYCNVQEHLNEVIIAICTRKECAKQSAICKNCQLEFHLLCGNNVIFLEDLPIQIRKMEKEGEIINQMFESLIQQLEKLQKQHLLLLKSISEYEQIINMTNLNNVGNVLRNTNVDLEKVLAGNVLISRFIDNYLNLAKPKELTQQQRVEAEELNAMGDGCYNRGEYGDAIEFYEAALSLNPFSEIYWNNKGFSLWKINKNQEAVQCYDQALKINPNDDTIWNNKGIALWDSNQYQDAIESYDQALKVNPTYYDAWNNKGAALRKINRFQEAIECYDKSITINPTSLNYFNKSFPLESLNQLKEAEVCLMKSLEFNPNYEDAKNRLKIIQEKQQK